MAGIQNWNNFTDNFPGVGLNPAWSVADTSAAGAPTKLPAAGGMVLGFSNDVEVQNLCLHFGDILSYDIDDIDHIEFGIKVSGTLDAATTLTFGLTSARNDDPDATTANAQFKLSGSNTVVVETDDGTTDNDDVATGKTLSTTTTACSISFANGKSDVRFKFGDSYVATSTTFSMAAYSAGLQPNIQLSKTADANTDSVTVEYVRVVCRR